MATQTLTIFGSSDDLIEVGGIEGADEFSKPNGSWIGVIEAPDGDTALVFVDYRPNGTWTVALAQYEEDYKLPAWPQSFEVDEELCRYSVKATIIVPEGTTIREIKKSDL